MATRLLVIHKQLVFAVTIKQALEQTGGFAVHPFTKAEAAFDFLRDHPQDIALVDLNLPGRSGSRIIQQLRSIQPDIAVIVSPQLSADDMRTLGVQGSIETPFTARDLLPLLQNALDEAIPPNTVESAPPPAISGQMTTSDLSEPNRGKRGKMATTQNLGESSLLNQNEPAQTRRFDNDELMEADKPQTKPIDNNPVRPISPTESQPKKVAGPFIDNPPPVKPATGKVDSLKTRIFDDADLSDLRPPQTKPFVGDSPPQQVPDADRFKTGNLEDRSSEEPIGGGTRILPDMQIDNYPVDTRRLPPDEDAPQTRNLGGQAGEEPPVAGTRILPDMQEENYPDNTRRLPSDEDAPQTRNLGGQVTNQFGTRKLDMDAAPPPPRPPEFSSLDQVLQSFGMTEPPPEEMDTPAVPTKNSDALRQFIATNTGDFDAGSFDDVLGAIQPDSPETPKKQRQVDFEGLVKSMQRDEPQRRLPDRQQQQLLDFVLTTGMDSVLQEIEKTKTGHLPKITPPPTPPEVEPQPERPAPNTSFRKLAQEEPPLPSLEENGTVSDLLVGISDSNFRDVLALLNDEPGNNNPEQPRKGAPPPEPSQPEVNYFDDFLQSTTIDSDSVPVPSQPRPARENYEFSFNYDDDEEDEGATVAGVVLRSTQENTSIPGEFSLDQLMSDINDRLSSHKLKVRPLPSWEMDTSAFHAPVTDSWKEETKPPKSRRPGEPSFLPEMFPPDEIIPPLEAAPPELPALETNEAVSEVWTTRASEPSLETIEPVDANGETMVEPGYFDETMVNEPARPIDSDMFSGILDEGTAYDEAPVYDAEAESSSNQTAAWDEPSVTIEVHPPTSEAEEAQFEADFEAAPADEFDTRTTQTAPEQYTDDFSSVLAQESYLPEAAQVDEWGTGLIEPQTETEATAESSSDAWNVPVTSEPEIQPEAVVENISEAWDVPATTEPEAPPEVAAEFISEAWDVPATEPEPVIETTSAASSEEARIAQLALNLTQVSLEVSAEGTILTRNNQIIALAGHLSQQDTIELATVINNDWGTGGQGARLRFITLPSSGKEYMLYSTGTEDDLILSMIFAGSTPLRAIRQQGQRLIKALGEVPDEKPATSITPAPRRDVQGVEEALEPYSYVWLVRDPEQRLNDAVAQSITAGLMTQLSEMRWQIEQLQVQDEYVYLYAKVPGETPSYAVVRELKQRAASIAQKQDNNLEAQGLWADSYLVLSPGRELAPDEIQEFVDFQRMM